MTFKEFIKQVFIVTIIVGIIYWIFEPLIYREYYINQLKEKYSREFNQTFEKYKLDIENKYNYINHEEFFEDKCFVNITRMNVSLLIQPIYKTFDNCNHLKLNYNKQNQNLTEQYLLKNYKFYIKNEFEILVSNDTIKVCGKFKDINLKKNKYENFNLEDYNPNDIYNLQFNLKNDTLIFQNKYNNNICNIFS